jgi:long-chain acyl-CoA synthetase
MFPSDIYLSFLPLPHVFERCVVHCCLEAGVNVCFFSGDILKVRDDAAVVKPTVFVAVPRLYNRIVEGVEKKFSEATGVAKCLASNGIESKK